VLQEFRSFSSQKTCSGSGIGACVGVVMLPIDDAININNLTETLSHLSLETFLGTSIFGPPTVVGTGLQCYPNNVS